MKKFLDLAGLIALWAKIKAYGGKKLNVLSNDNSALEVITMNENSNDKTLEIKGDNTWIGGAVTTSTNKVTVTLSHKDANAVSVNDRINTNGTPNNYLIGTEYTVLTGITLDADSKGHLAYDAGDYAGEVTKLKIKDTNRPIKVGGTQKLANNNGTAVDFVNGVGTLVGWEDSGSKIKYDLKSASTTELGGFKASNTLLTAQTLTSGNGNTANRFYGVLVDSNGVAFVNVPWTDSQNVGEANLTLKADKLGSSNDSSGGVVFNANESTGKTVEVLGGNQITTTRSVETNSQTVTIDHDTIGTSGGSAATKDSATASNYIASGNLLSDITINVDNGHVTHVTPTYKKIPFATETTGGLMSLEDKKALNQINQTIANALTSAITPKGSISAVDLVEAVLQQNTLLSSSHVGDLYQLSSPLVIGPTQTGDVSLYYSNFAEGNSITNNGEVRHEFPAGSYVMVVNTGTASNPVYLLDAVSGLYDMSNYATLDDLNSVLALIKAIPVDTLDEDYEAGDDTIDSICV